MLYLQNYPSRMKEKLRHFRLKKQTKKNPKNLCCKRSPKKKKKKMIFKKPESVNNRPVLQEML